MTTPEDIRRQIEDAIAPPLTVQQAIDFIEEVMADLEGTLDGLRADLKQA